MLYSAHLKLTACQFSTEWTHSEVTLPGIGMWHCSLHIHSMHIYASCAVDKYIFIRYKSRITSNLPNAATCESLFSKFLTIVHIYITQYISSFLRVILKGILSDSWLCGPGSVIGITTGYGLDVLGCESHRGHGYLSVVSFVCFQVEVSATSWSLVQRSPTDCAASLFVM
jgi:hypothetical protein